MWHWPRRYVTALRYSGAMGYDMFEGEKVRLRGVRADDWDSFTRWDLDSDAGRFGWQVMPPKGEEAAKEFARAESAKQPDPANQRFIIETLEGEAAGSLNYRADLRRFGFEYGISLAREHWGSGYAEDALRILFRYLFGELRLHKAQAYVYGFNQRSLSMHRKFGMTHEGVLREAQFTAGRFWDIHIFGMTADEFFARYGASWGEPLETVAD